MSSSKRPSLAAKLATKRQRLMAPSDNPNADHLQRVADNYNLLLSHSVFEDITTADPVAIAEGEGARSGHQSVYQFKEFQTSIMETGHYKCAYNLMAVDFMWSPSPRVPIRRSTIPKLKKHYFSQPTLYPNMITVAVSSAEDDINFLRGDLHAVSPQEVRDALLERIVEAINTGESEDCEGAFVVSLPLPPSPHNPPTHQPPGPEPHPW